jgi:hypothetical protein
MIDCRPANPDSFTVRTVFCLPVAFPLAQSALFPVFHFAGGGKKVDWYIHPD